jgi:hypothetical protein
LNLNEVRTYIDVLGNFQDSCRLKQNRFALLGA